MRHLILSDLHSNWQALCAVLESASGAYERILCCGDVVGYGADPNLVTEWARRSVSTIVRGNHDKACAGLEDLEWFNPLARASALWTQQELSEENLQYLRELPRGPLKVGGFQLIHGSPIDEDEYLVDSFEASLVRAYLEYPLYFFGHTHAQGGFAFHDGRVRRIGRPALHSQTYTLEMEPGVVYLVNPGSVGQPRDGDKRAAYLLYDDEGRWVRYCRVPYDIPAAQKRILAAGLPPLLADRLAIGR